MEQRRLILAVDGGGSTSQAALYEEDGTLRREAVVGPLSRKSSGEEAVAASLGELRCVLEDEGRLVRAAVLGLSGLDDADDIAAMGRLMARAGICPDKAKPRKHSFGHRCEAVWSFPMLLCSDALLPLFANGLSEGAVVIAGTGSVALRVGPKGSVERFGGWGYGVSDEGSGCWVGLAFVGEALHVADELLSGLASPSAMPGARKTLLDEAFLATRKHWGQRAPLKAPLERKARLLREWACAHDDPKDYARLARPVLESRSSACRDIRRRAAERLGWLAALACTSESPAVVLSGGLFANPGFAEQVARCACEASSVEGMQVVANTAPPTLGAFEMARRLWPLRPDVPAASSANVRRSMQGNKGTDTKPELVVRRRLREAGLGGYRLHWKAPGRPDVAWPSKKVCILINGCFWHRHEGCAKATMPKSNTDYWIAKFDRNVERDAENLRALKADGWRVHVVWECELEGERGEETFAALIPALREELAM